MADSGATDLKDIHVDHKNASHASLVAENRKLSKSLRQAKQLSLVCAIVTIVAFGAIIAILVNDSIDDETPKDDDPKDCGVRPKGLYSPRINLKEPEKPSPFHDVTVKEIRRIQEFLKENDVITVKPEDAHLNDTYIYTIDLENPDKAKVLNHTDHGGDAPDRYARVYLFRGSLDDPVVEERLCGPLHNISMCDVVETGPYAYRPIENREYNAFEEKLLPDINTEFGTILRESFGGSFDFENCEDDCFNWWATLVSSNAYGEANVRKIWLTPDYDLSYYSLFPVDMSFLCNVNGTDPHQFHVEQVWYAGELFETPTELIDRYANNSINKIVGQPYPTEEQAEFATLKQRGDPRPRQSLRAPELIEPDGKRYNIYHRMVEYLDLWSFHVRNSPIYGPLLYDIRFNGERVIYELSLQELSTIYSGSGPFSRLNFFVNSAFLTGGKSKALVPGADCPKTATFLPITVTSQGREQPAVFRRSICIFEQNTGSPLRRHHSYSQDEKTFYGGMLDSALIMRSIHAVDNVDYIVDFTFHQNGALGVSVTPTGYLSGTSSHSETDSYGHKIHDFLFGSMFHFVANFKVDLDIGAETSNSYQTVDIMEETVPLKGTNPSKPYSQTKLQYDHKMNEMEAAYKIDFSKPTHHIFHEAGMKNKYQQWKSYRIVNQSPSMQLITKGVGPEPSVSWARYQLAVTKRKEKEQRSSSFYAQYDGLNPAVNFQSFVEDNETISEEDLVAWVTIGDHHIPTTEDLPVASTAGKKKSFYILPYNYFYECPSMASRDAVYIDEKDPDKPADGLMFDFFGTGDVSQDTDTHGACTAKPVDITKLWSKNPDELFAINYNKGVY